MLYSTILRRNIVPKINRTVPPLKDPLSISSRVKRVRLRKVKRAKVSQLLSQFTVLWVNRLGVPFNTTGFFLRVFRGGFLIAVVPFDSFGTAVVPNFFTPISTNLVIQTVSSLGFVFRQRRVPAGVSSFVVIG